MPATYITLKAGDSIRPSGSSTRGRLGLLTIDSDKRIYGLIAGHIVNEQNQIMVRDSDGRSIGRLQQNAQPKIEPQSIIHSVALFEVEHDVRIDITNMNNVCFAAPVSMTFLMGQSLRKEDLKSTQLATVTGLYGIIRLTSPPHETGVRYIDVIEVRPDSPDDFAKTGDGGALLATKQNEPAGLLIAGSGHRFFLAPIFELMKEWKLRLLDPVDVVKHNMRNYFGESRSTVEPLSEGAALDIIAQQARDAEPPALAALLKEV